MDNENAIVQLLTEIRDNQQKQMEVNRDTQAKYMDFVREQSQRQSRRASILAIVVGIGAGFLIWIMLAK